jgi:hypothetical protein
MEFTNAQPSNRQDRERAVERVRIEIVAPDGSRRAITGSFRMFAAKVLLVSTTEPVAASTAVSVEHNDMLFIGEVAGSETQADSSFTMRISVKHTLTNLQSLMNLRGALLEADAYAPVKPQQACVST